MGLAEDLKAGVASARAAVEPLQEPLVWTRAGGERVGTVDGIVQQIHRLTQNAKGDGNVRAGYVITVLGAMDGATLGDTLTVDGKTRRIVGVRGPREGGGERLVTTLDVASHGPIFDPAFFVDTVSVDAQRGVSRQYESRTEYRAAVQLSSVSQSTQGGLVEVEHVKSRIVFPGNASLHVGDRVVLSDAYDNLHLHIGSLDRVVNPDDGGVDHIIALW